MEMFRSCENKGFQVGFSNGYVVSCQFGTFSYCNKRSFEPGDLGIEKTKRVWESPDCEVAIFDKSGEFVTGEIFDKAGLDLSNDGMVAGWVSADDVGKIISYVKDLEV